MKIVRYEDLNKSFFEFNELENINDVKEILKDVKNSGDKAVKKYSKKFDSIESDNYEISRQEIMQAYEKVDKKTIKAFKKSAENITKFSKKQLKQLKNFETKIKGNKIGQKVIPIEKVGCYVPGGNYPLPSSALMSIIPAKVAGVKEIIVCSPKIDIVTMISANIAGADRIFNVGGVQAIGAMAYGTETLPKVDKIIGPGNNYVTMAKKEVYGAVGVDLLAGPSEVMIIADKNSDSEKIASDLLAQAEHDYNARPDLVTTSNRLAKKVNLKLKSQINKLKTKDIAQKALNNGRIIVTDSISQCIEIANKRAPEHLEILLDRPRRILDDLRNYGSLFLGENSAEVFGDYCSGTNHTLPTNGSARYAGGLSVNDFVKILTYQKVSKKGLKCIKPLAETLAEIEGLDGHKKSSELR